MALVQQCDQCKEMIPENSLVYLEKKHRLECPFCINARIDMYESLLEQFKKQVQKMKND